MATRVGESKSLCLHTALARSQPAPTHGPQHNAIPDPASQQSLVRDWTTTHRPPTPTAASCLAISGHGQRSSGLFTSTCLCICSHMGIWDKKAFAQNLCLLQNHGIFLIFLTKKKRKITCFKTHKLSLPTKLFQVPSSDAREKDKGDWEV